MNNRYLKILGSIIILIIISLIIALTYKYVASLFLMENRITFSASIIVVFFTSPLILYSLSGSVYFFIFNRLPKHNKIIVKYLSAIMFASFIICLPFSFYVGYKLGTNGYSVCDKISWMSPTTYVKNLSLCE